MALIREGAKAPAFKAKDQHDNIFTSASMKGKKWVLYFYPQDNTPTCTVQACNLRDSFESLTGRGIEVIGVSPDEVKKHIKFAEKFNLPFTLLADTDHAVIDKYGVWGEKQLYGRKYMGLHRTTFLIDEKGVIRKIIAKPKSKQHAEEILQAWQIIENNGK